LEIRGKTVVRPAKLLVSTIFVSALLPNWAGFELAVGAERHVSTQHGANAADHMSEKGFANGNAQWSADPEKGWVRAEKRHKLHEQKGTPRDSNREFDKAKHKRKTD
jgi:predicted secreted Zn-dependent protease